MTEIDMALLLHTYLFNNKGNGLDLQ